MVRGAKARPRVKGRGAEVWSGEQKSGRGSSQPPPECGPGSETAPPGQASPRPSVVQGAKPRPQVKPAPAGVWSGKRNRAPRSSQSPPQCGPGSETAPPGQASPRPNVVRGAKPRPQVKPVLAGVWSREQNRGCGSSQSRHFNPRI